MGEKSNKLGKYELTRTKSSWKKKLNWLYFSSRSAFSAHRANSLSLEAKTFDLLAWIDSTLIPFIQVIYPHHINEHESFCFGFYDWNFDEDTQSFSAWLACAVSLMTVTAAKFNQKPLCLSLQENDDLFQQLTSNNVVPRVLGLFCFFFQVGLFVCSTTQSGQTELSN